MDSLDSSPTYSLYTVSLRACVLRDVSMRINQQKTVLFRSERF